MDFMMKMCLHAALLIESVFEYVILSKKAKGQGLAKCRMLLLSVLGLFGGCYERFQGQFNFLAF